MQVRQLGIVTGASLATAAISALTLPRPADAFVGALSLLVAAGAGVQFAFHGSMLVSAALQGRRRTQFQVAVSLAAPLLFSLSLATYADAVPVETLRTIVTAWLLVPMGVIAWVCWYAGSHVDRDHPFRAFLIAATIIGVLCWAWTMGMTSDSDSSDEGGSSFYFDKEQRQRARETGEYVWRFILYTSAAYLALFLSLRWRMRTSPQDEAFRKLNDTLTPDAVNNIVSTMGGFIADRHARPARVADLPFPKIVIEMAYIKAMRSCTDPKRLDLLKAVYITLDEYMLSDEDWLLLTKYREFWENPVPRTDEAALDLAKQLDHPDMLKAKAIWDRLTEAMHKRSEVIDQMPPPRGTAS